MSESVSLESRDGGARTAVSVISWNVNGLRSLCPTGVGDLFQRLPHRDTLGFLCVQETKLSRLSRDLCIADGYHSYFSLCRNCRDTGRDRGYSGVATFVRKDIPTLRAQEGFVGTGDPAADVHSLDGLEGAAGVVSRKDAQLLSGEGRVLITGTGRVVRPTALLADDDGLL